jgi:hypothetical protein
MLSATEVEFSTRELVIPWLIVRNDCW